MSKLNGARKDHWRCARDLHDMVASQYHPPRRLRRAARTAASLRGADHVEPHRRKHALGPMWRPE